MQGPFLRKYGVETTINFDLYEVDGVDLRVDAAHAAGDSKIMKDEGAEANTTNGFTDEGSTYSIVLTAGEMEAARIKIILIDSATKVWLDDTIVVETYGNASAMHAMDFDDAVRGGMTALPNAAADAAGGVPISDAGGLDLDAILADTNELQADDVPGLISTHDGKLDTVDGIVDNILTDTAVIGALGAGLTGIPWNSAWDAEAQSEMADALAAFFTSAAQLVDDVWDEVLTGATHNVNNSAGKRLRGIDAAFEVSSGTARAGTSTSITLAADESATDDIYNGDRIVIVGGTGQGEHSIATDYDGTSKVATMSKAWVVTPDATSEYEVVPADTDVETWNNVGVTSDGDWNELQTDVDTILADTNELQTDWTNAGRLDALIDLILADTGELQTDWANAGRLDALIDLILADTGELQTDWVNAGRLDAILDLILADTGELQTDDVPGLISTHDGKLDTVDGVVDTILADTNELQTDWANAGRLDALIDLILGDTGELQTDWANAGRLDTILDAILDDTGTAGVVIATATAQAIADELLKRGVSNVEDAADAHSLATIILAVLESSLSGTTWTIKKTGGTTFTTKTVTVDAAADPITAVT